MRMDCDAVRENVDAWALGALDADETRALETHLTSCDDCRALAAAALETAASIGLAVPLHGASATLKSRVMASAAVLTDIRSGRRSRLWPGAVAALLIIGVGALSWGVIAQLRMSDLEDRNATLSADATAQSTEIEAVRADLGEAATMQKELSETIGTQDAVIDIVLQPDVQRTELLGTAMAPGASGRCVWSRAQAVGALIVGGLPKPPEDSVYTMWIVYEREWVDAGRFTVDDGGRGRLVMRTWGGGEADWGAFEGFAVTIERASGAHPDRGETVMRSVLAN